MLINKTAGVITAIVITMVLLIGCLGTKNNASSPVSPATPPASSQEVKSIVTVGWKIETEGSLPGQTLYF